MLLNSKFSDFAFEFQPNFIPKNINDKYISFIKNYSVPFDNVVQFINWSIQSVSWPELAIENAQQFGYSGKRNYKSGQGTPWFYSQKFTVTFKTTEAYLNYFIIQDVLTDFLNNNQKGQYRLRLPDFQLNLLDFDGDIIISYLFKNIIIDSISTLTLSYAENQAEYKTFDVGFTYDMLEIKTEFD